MKKFFYLIPAAILFLASCASSRSAYQLAGEWNVVNIDGTAITPGQDTPFIGFNLNEGVVYGFTGCNRMTSNINPKSFIKGDVDFSQVATTRMACRDDKYERIFLDALKKVTTSEVNDNEILLKDDYNKTIMVLKKK